jgi:hypothetical protein
VDYIATYDGSGVSGAAHRYSLAGFQLVRTSWNRAGNAVAYGVLNAKAGFVRHYTGLYHMNNPGQAAGANSTVMTGGFWNDTTTKITSLRIAVTANSFSGKIILFKVSA